MPSTQAVETHDTARARELLLEAQKALAESVDMELPPERVHPMPNQPRKNFNQEELANLEASIRTAGQWCRGIIRKKGDDYELIDGTRRHAAVSRIEGRLYRATCVDIKDDAIIPYLIAVTLNANRANFSVLELAAAVEYLYDTLRLPIEEAARAAGVTVPKARQLLQLRHLRPEVRALLDPTLPKFERIPVTAAAKIAMRPTSEQGRLARGVVEGRIDSQTLLPNKGGGYAVSEPRVRSQRETQGSRVIGFRITVLQHAAGALLTEMQKPECTVMLRTGSHDLDPEMVLARLQRTFETLRECQAVVVRMLDTEK